MKPRSFRQLPDLSSPTAVVAVTLCFGVNGLILGGFGASLPSLRDKLGIDATHIAIMLFCGAAAGITSMQIGGRLADSRGARQITLAALPLLLTAAILLAATQSFPI